jgi:hypothetical protein
MTHIRGPWLTVLAWLFVLCIVGACSDDGGWTPTEPEPEPEAGSSSRTCPLHYISLMGFCKTVIKGGLNVCARTTPNNKCDTGEGSIAIYMLSETDWKRTLLYSGCTPTGGAVKVCCPKPPELPSSCSSP